MTGREREEEKEGEETTQRMSDGYEKKPRSLATAYRSYDAAAATIVA
jgi:hypothetical protein